MKHIKPSENPARFPRMAVKSVETRKRDLVVRIADWTRTKDAPFYDVEVYVGGAYDFNLSASLPTKAQAIAFAQKKIAELL